MYAALWFTEKLVLRNFLDQAKAKKFKIKSSNEALMQCKVPSQHKQAFDKKSNTCRSCNTIFNMHSKPSICKSCGLYYHSTCLKDHSRICAISDSLMGSSPSPKKVTLTPDPQLVGISSSLSLNDSNAPSPDLMMSIVPPAADMIPQTSSKISPTAEPFIPQTQDHCVAYGNLAAGKQNISQ